MILDRLTSWWAGRRRPPVLERDLIDRATDDVMGQERSAVVVSLDRSIQSRLGFTRWTFGRQLRRAGLEPLWLDYGDGPEAVDLQSLARGLVSRGHGLVLSGGQDVDPARYGGTVARHTEPRRDRFELALVEAALDLRLPIFGICRGSQLLNVALGGTLKSLDSEPLRRRHARLGLHDVAVAADSELAAVTGSVALRVRSTHSQAVDRPAASIRVVGRAEDGVVEAFEHVPERDGGGSWIVGVQWHPELRFFRHDEHRLFGELARRVRARASEAPLTAVADRAA